MAGVKPYIERGPAVYTVSSAVTGGQLVMPDSTTGLIKTATAGAATVLGVAADDAVAAGSGSATDYGTLRPEVAVYTAPAEVKVLFAANAAFGVKVKAAATGQVTPWVSGTDAADLIVGYVTEPAGVLAAARGRIKLH